MVYKLGHLIGLDDHSCLIMVFLLSVALVCLGVALIAVAIAKRCGRIPLLLIAAPIGVYALTIIPFWIITSVLNLHNPFEGPLPLYGTLWSFMNGMESGLAIASFGGVALCCAADARQQLLPAIALGVTLALLTLSRLDHVFIAAGILLAHSLPVLQHRERRGCQCLAVTVLVFATPILLYAYHNAVFFGSVVPLSGVSKSTFPIPHLSNIIVLRDVVLYPFSDGLWLDRFYRLSQILLPCLAAGLFCLARSCDVPFLRKRHQSSCDDNKDLDRFLFGSSVGILLLGVYNFFFVVPFGPGHWYFPVSILYVTICVVVRVPVRVPRRSGLLVTALAMVCLSVFWTLHRRSGYHKRFMDFYFDEAPRVVAHYGKSPPRLIEYDDGIVAYATGFSTMSGLGLTLDREAHEAKEIGEFHRLARGRGYDLITSLVYMNFTEEDLANLEWLDLSSNRMTFQLDYRADDGSFGIVRFYPKGTGP